MSLEFDFGQEVRPGFANGGFAGADFGGAGREVGPAGQGFVDQLGGLAPQFCSRDWRVGDGDLERGIGGKSGGNAKVAEDGLHSDIRGFAVVFRLEQIPFGELQFGYRG